MTQALHDFVMQFACSKPDVQGTFDFEGIVTGTTWSPRYQLQLLAGDYYVVAACSQMVLCQAWLEFRNRGAINVGVRLLGMGDHFVIGSIAWLPSELEAHTKPGI